MHNNHRLLQLPNIGVSLGTTDNPDDLAVTLTAAYYYLQYYHLLHQYLIMTTSYLRIIIVFHFLKTALGTQQMPPNQLLAGVALFVTFFVMTPTWKKFNDNALQPYLDKKITVEEAYDKGIEPIREFMLKNTRPEELKFFYELADIERPNTAADLPITILIPSFVSE